MVKLMTFFYSFHFKSIPKSKNMFMHDVCHYFFPVKELYNYFW